VLLTVPITPVSLAVRFRRARGLEGQQLRWLAFAAGLASVGAVLVLAGTSLPTSTATAPPWPRSRRLSQPAQMEVSSGTFGTSHSRRGVVSTADRWKARAQRATAARVLVAAAFHPPTGGTTIEASRHRGPGCPAALLGGCRRGS
jgi:hypothetical protein